MAADPNSLAETLTMAYYLRLRRTALLQRRGALINVTGDEGTLSAAAPHISSFLSALPAEAGARCNWSNALSCQNEALTVPTQVRPRPTFKPFCNAPVSH